MTGKNIFLIILALIIIGTIFLIVRGQGESSDPSPVNTTVEEEVVSNQLGYVAYADEAARSAAKDGDAVLFFHASWCPTCRALKNNLRNSQIPEDLTILEIDYDTENELKRKYGVTYQHTLIQVDENLDEIKKFTGTRTLSEILREIN